MTTAADHEAVVTALYDSNMRHAGVAAADGAFLDAVLQVAHWKLPELPAMIDAVLTMLQASARERLEPDSMKAFDNTVATFQEQLRRV